MWTTRSYYLFSVCWILVTVSIVHGQDVCPPLPAPENGMVTQPNPVTAGSQAQFTCNTGYTIGGSTVRLCRVTGQWIGVDTTCTPVACPALLDPTNGVVMVTAATFMNTATYSCEPGYQLEGDSNRTCQSTGLWSGTEPTCNAVDCGSLDSPTNGIVLVTDTTFMSEATYSCDSSYRLEGNATRMCLSTGSWSGNEPTCNFITCGDPPSLENGMVSFTGTAVDSFAIYSCNEGYNPSSADNTIRFCTTDGEWTDSPLSCQIVTCRRLFNPQNGMVTFTDEFNFGSAANYNCIPGYEVIGMSIRACQASGEWNGTEPSCQRIDCGPPSDVDNGSVTFGLTTFDALAGYSCDEGFQLNPPSQNIRTCSPDRAWSGPDPACDPVDCGSPSIPSNGLVEYNTTSYLSMANYSCEPEAELSPAEGAQRVCENDGQWSGPDPVCNLLIQCPELISPENGLVTITSVSTRLPRTTGSSAQYECGSGYQLQGNQTRECDSNGAWSGQDPTCGDVDECLTENGGCEQICFNTDGSFQCDCVTGYRISSNGLTCDDVDECSLSMDNCHSNATCSNTLGGFTCACQEGFQGDGLVCEVDCGLLPSLANGRVVYTPNTLVGGVATHSCDSGFVLEGGEERVCLSNGDWEPADISCLQVVYVEFGLMEYTVVENINSAILGVFKRNVTGRTIIVSFSTREGTAEAPRDFSERANVRLTFPPGQTELFVTLTINDDTEFRGNRTFYGVLGTSEPGVEVGPETRVLIIDDEPPNEECVSLDSPVNGTIFINTTQIGDVVSYQCDTGFNLIGEQNRTCNFVGLWTGRDPTCQIADCGPLSDPPNGTVSLSSTTYLSTATYACDANFRQEGALSRACTAEGVWSPEEPICVDILAVCELCDPRARCNQLGPLEYACECFGGFQGDGLTCIDIDECSLGLDNCDDENANCQNSMGGYSCSCNTGYSGGGITCQNTDECSEGLDSCHPRAICTDTEGSFTCACRPGFEGDGFSCEAPPCFNNFQIVFEDITMCSAWFVDAPLAKVSDITTGVLSVVNTECEGDCQLLPSQITNAQLDCTIANVAVYRATINVTNGENCTQLIGILSDWVSTGPSLLVQAIRLRIAPYCEVEFESFEVRSDCVDPLDNGTRPTLETQTTDESTSAATGSGIQLSMEEIIAVSAVGGGVGLLLILAALVICCVFVIRVSRVSKKPAFQSVEGSSSGNDALFFRETPSQRRRRNKPTYGVDGDAEFTTFNPANDPAPALRTSYLQMTTPVPGFQDNTVMHNQGVADLEFPQ